MPSTRITDCVIPLANAWLQIRERYKSAHPGHDVIVTCSQRPQEEQFQLYCKGRRQLADGSWVVDEDATTTVVTNCDGYRVTSKHNKVPSQAIDFAIILPGGKVSWDPREYEPVGVLAENAGLVWGGRWPHLKDYPHVEVRS